MLMTTKIAKESFHGSEPDFRQIYRFNTGPFWLFWLDPKSSAHVLTRHFQSTEQRSPHHGLRNVSGYRQCVDTGLCTGRTQSENVEPTAGLGSEATRDHIFPL